MTKAREPEDLTRLFVELANKGDARGMAELYEDDAVMAYPPGSQTVGREAIQKIFEELVTKIPHFEQEQSYPTLRHGDLALTSTKPSDNTGGRTQIVREQADGSWLRVIDRPETKQ
jgi:ketosteroid isomerase-like protein